MSTMTMNIGGTQLLSLIQGSHLEGRQKAELTTLAPNMTEAERTELVALIAGVNDAFEKAEVKKNEKLAAIDHEYDTKLKNVVRQEMTNIRKGAETFEQDKSNEAVKTLESEMKTTNIVAKRLGTPDASMTRHSMGHHTKLKFTLAIVTLFLVAGAILYGISKL